MDEKYFNKKIDSILDCFTLWLLNEYCITDAEEDKAKAILHQIAKDFFAAGAEAQRVAIDEKLSHEFYFRRGPNSEEPIMYASEILAAINTATVKEVPGV